MILIEHLAHVTLCMMFTENGFQGKNFLQFNENKTFAKKLYARMFFWFAPFIVRRTNLYGGRLLIVKVHVNFVMFVKEHRKD